MYADLKKLREKQKMTYEELAMKVGISKEYYWMIENGERDGFSYKLAVQIAKAVNRKPDDIFLKMS
ncbi:helix-turn-helix transcriptional regulator [Listeria booriae]|uniref:helix-turn-helix transcriptional regulator n=1 Tax=Listeria booriae TaxID=1552123 RepID=UPI001625430E|nr:helix-turn-helix transcriptional regulator [Listeria booriae]MBC1247324.1 helix-turn-helix transcriptional regulator [Listeria booriae]